MSVKAYDEMSPDQQLAFRAGQAQAGEMQAAGEAMARKLTRLSAELNRRGYDDSPEIDRLVARWRELVPEKEPPGMVGPP